MAFLYEENIILACPCAMFITVDSGCYNTVYTFTVIVLYITFFS